MRKKTKPKKALHSGDAMLKHIKSRYRITAFVVFVALFAGIGYWMLRGSRAASADINGDGTINILDLSILAANYGQSPRTFAQGDTNGDNIVNILDLSVLAVNWGNNPGGGGQTNWAAVGTQPLTDAAAAAKVVHKSEIRTDNATTNAYVPTTTEISAFLNTVGSSGQKPAVYNPLYPKVTGKPGLVNPSTDDLIQWTAWKWGIPEDTIRAVMVQESQWHQSSLSQQATVSSTWYNLYPLAARVVPSDIKQSMGVMQIEWRPDQSRNPGANPLRYKSTAFSLDYWGATIRYYYDGSCTGCGSGYASGQQWPSIGAWFNPTPWNATAAQSYVTSIQSILATKPWLQTGF